MLAVRAKADQWLEDEVIATQHDDDMKTDAGIIKN